VNMRETGHHKKYRRILHDPLLSL